MASVDSVDSVASVEPLLSVLATLLSVDPSVVPSDPDTSVLDELF